MQILFRAARAVLASLVGLLSLPAQASDIAGTGFVLDGTAEFGGDPVATVLYSDGSTQTVKAGQGLGFDLGIHHRFEEVPYSLRATIGYKYVTTQADNADIHLSRVPLELVGSCHFDNELRLGAGVVHHTSTKFSGGGVGPDLSFKPATGFTLEAGWKALLLSGTFIKYTDEFGGTYSANSFGVKVIGEF